MEYSITKDLRCTPDRCEEAAEEERDGAGGMGQLRSLRRVMVSCLTFVGKPCLCSHIFCGGATRTARLVINCGIVGEDLGVALSFKDSFKTM